MPEADAISCGYPGCGVLFVPTKHWQRFCTARCRLLEWRRQCRIEEIKALGDAVVAEVRDAVGAST